MFSQSGLKKSPLPSLIAAAIGLSVLAGCGSLGGSDEALDTFELASPSVDQSQPVRRGVQILITEPAALKALDSENIVVETAPLTIQYLDGSQWSDRLPRVVQQKLAEAFDSADKFGGVGLPGQGLAIDYQVISEVRKFGIDASRNTADVQIAVKLLNDRTGNVIGSRTFSASTRASSNSNEAYVSAINAAFTQVSEDIVVWVTTKI